MMCLSVGEEQDRAVPPFKQGVKDISRPAQLFPKVTLPLQSPDAAGMDTSSTFCPQVERFLETGAACLVCRSIP